jgi:hypothetical protein
MKKKIFTAILALASLSVYADPSAIVSDATTLEKGTIVEIAKDSAVWTFPGSMGVNANQAYFNDYCTDGTGASVSLDAFLNLNANYMRNKVLWENSLSAKYGFIYSSEFTGEDLIRKNMDELILNTKYGYKVSKSWYLSAFANLETQFSKGYNYESDVNGQDSAVAISEFFAPGYLKVSLGMEYIPNKYFSAFLSPITARFTFCRNELLAPNYSMELNPTTGEYEKFRAELGAYFKLKSDFDVTEWMHFFSTLEGFYAYNKAVQALTDEYVDWYGSQDYLSENFVDDESIKYHDIHGWYVKWKLELLFKISKYVNLSVKTQLKYDNAETKTLEDKNFGLPHAKVQFWETTSLGVAYSF